MIFEKDIISDRDNNNGKINSLPENDNVNKCLFQISLQSINKLVQNPNIFSLSASEKRRRGKSNYLPIK